MRKIAVVMVMLAGFCSNSSKAQTPQDTLYSIYAKYDSLEGLTFDIKYTYTSDTLYGDFIYDVLEGNYTMYGKKALFHLGDIDYMQNDSFFVAVYKKDEIILVTDPRKTNSGSFLPLREQMDSLMLSYAEHYTNTTSENDSTGKIVFTAKDSMAQFKSYVIEYDAQVRVMLSLNYEFEELVPVDPETSSEMVMRTRRLKVEFLKYRFDNFSEDLYDESKYIFFENGEWKPASQYASFRVFYSRTGFVQQVEPPQ
jgi:hypothetical protein